MTFLANPTSDAPPAGPYAARTLDPKRVAAIKQMCRPERPDACVRVAGAFLHDLDNKLPPLIAALESENLREVARLAHYLKGSASVVGATGLSAVLEDLDRDARAGVRHDAAAAQLEAIAVYACTLVRRTFGLA